MKTTEPLPKRSTRRVTIVTAVLASLLAVPLAHSITDLVVNYTADFGSGSTFGFTTPAASVGYANGAAERGLTVGQYLLLTQVDQVAVGRYNATGIGIIDGPLVVGIGTGSGDKRNAFEVHYDGAVVGVVPQADISMGEFGD